MQTRTIYTLAELKAIVEVTLTQPFFGDGAGVITLSGELGVGKTAYVKQLAQCVGIQEEITSPTFVVMKSYAIPNHPRFTTLTHIDAYRIESEDEMRVLGFQELCVDPARLIVIEWPERIPSCIPATAHRLTLTLQGEARIITF